MKNTLFPLMLFGLAVHSHPAATSIEAQSTTSAQQSTTFSDNDVTLLEQKLLTDIIKRNFKQFTPDSLKHKSDLVNISFHIATDGSAYGITASGSTNKQLKALVEKSVKEMPKLKMENLKGNSSLNKEHAFYIVFPSINVYNAAHESI